MGIILLICYILGNLVFMRYTTNLIGRLFQHKRFLELFVMASSLLAPMVYIYVWGAGFAATGKNLLIFSFLSFSVGAAVSHVTFLFLKLVQLLFVFYSNFSLRARLTLSYITLIIVSLSILGIGYYYKSSDVIFKNASETILVIVKKSNQSLNSRFSLVEENAINMHLDEDLFDFFNTRDLKNRYLSYENDRRITRILQKYFPYSEEMFSVNLVTKDYIFGGNPNFWIPKTDFLKANIYNIGLEAIENTKWIPTYNLLERYYSASSDSRDKSQLVFTATRLINSSEIRNNMLYHLDKELSRPVLVVNFKEAMLQKAFKESMVVEGSYYYVFSQNGEVVSHSNNNNGAPENKAWVRNAMEKKSGTEYVYIGGKKMLVCFDTIDTTGWLSAVFIPYDKLLLTVPNMLSFTLYSTAFIIFFSIVMSFLISERITFPLKQLLAGIKKIGDGNFGNKIETKGAREINILIHKFNQMNEKIELLIEENYQIYINEMEAELKALNFQFNPHFLYNTLNVINCLAIENKQTHISNMLVELSEMLEYISQNPGAVSFEDDLKYLQNYTYIMTKRHDGRFTVQYQIDPLLNDYSVPKFFLQPFIENALMHGIEEIEQGGYIKISGWIEGDLRIFCVEDNGKGMTLETINRVLDTGEELAKMNKSIGIQNVNRRVKLLYGKHYGVQIESEINHGTKVTITLPFNAVEKVRRGIY